MGMMCILQYELLENKFLFDKKKSGSIVSFYNASGGSDNIIDMINI